MCQGVHIKLFSRCREELFMVIEKGLGILEENGQYYFSIYLPRIIY